MLFEEFSKKSNAEKIKEIFVNFEKFYKHVKYQHIKK